MNELIAAHQPLPHKHFAPSAEAIRQLYARHVSDDFLRGLHRAIVSES